MHASRSNPKGRTISNKLPQLGEKRKRLDKGLASDPLTYQGPWAGYEGENVHIEIETKEVPLRSSLRPKNGRIIYPFPFFLFLHF